MFWRRGLRPLPLRPEPGVHLYMSDMKPSFTRGLYAGAILDAAIFPYPPTLEQRDPAMAKLAMESYIARRHQDIKKIL